MKRIEAGGRGDHVAAVAARSFKEKHGGRDRRKEAGPQTAGERGKHALSLAADKQASKRANPVEALPSKGNPMTNTSYPRPVPARTACGPARGPSHSLQPPSGPGDSTPGLLPCSLPDPRLFLRLDSTRLASRGTGGASCPAS